MIHSIRQTGPQELLVPLRSQPHRSGIVCDIDGTLASIVLDPEEASVPEPTRALLAELNRRYALVACVSGRRAADARRTVGVGTLTYVGNHGLESLQPGADRAETDPAVASWTPAVRAFATDSYTVDLQRTGIRLEDKHSIWSFHWRGVPDEAGARAALERLATTASERGFAPHWGRKVLEIRPPVPVDKGTALAGLVRKAGLDLVLYAGDDVTDLDGFRKLRKLRADGALQHAVSVGVSSSEAPEELAREADLVVDGPAGLAELLAALAA